MSSKSKSVAVPYYLDRKSDKAPGPVTYIIGTRLYLDTGTYKSAFYRFAYNMKPVPNAGDIFIIRTNEKN